MPREEDEMLLQRHPEIVMVQTGSNRSFQTSTTVCVARERMKIFAYGSNCVMKMAVEKLFHSMACCLATHIYGHNSATIKLFNRSLRSSPKIVPTDAGDIMEWLATVP